MNSKSRKNPPWADLPQELLTTIATLLKLSNPIAFLSFRCVCKSWFSSSLSSNFTLHSIFPPFPLKIPPLPFSLTNRLMPRHDHFVLSVTAVCFLRPPIQHEGTSSSISRVGWVLFLDQCTPGKVSIRQPFARNSYSLPFNFPKSMNLVGYHAYEMCRFYNLSCLSVKEGKPFSWYEIILKVVCVRCIDSLFIVALLDQGKLGLLRLELGLRGNDENVGGNSKWEIIHNGEGYRFDDIIQFRDDLLGIDRRGSVYKIDIELVSPVSIKVIVPRIAGGGGRRKRLVESLGQLYLVVRNNVPKKSNALFKIYELNQNAKKWVQVNSLGDQTFFIGHEFSFSVSTEELHGSTAKNCIVYKHKSFENYNGDDDDYELFKNLRHNYPRVAVWNMEDAVHLSLIKTQPEYLNVLWPPPYWIWPINIIERFRNVSTALDQLLVRIPLEKLKSKFGELSHLQQKNVPVLERLVNLIKRLQYEVKLFEDTLKRFEMVVMSRRQQRQFVPLLNQVGTSNLENEEMRVILGEIEKAVIEHDCGFDWYAVETQFDSCIFWYEENFSEIEDIFNSIENMMGSLSNLLSD